MELDKLEKVDLRKAWNHEALDFTNWLSKQENLDLLSDELGIENIRLTQTEAPVGGFNVDILAEEETTGNKIIIENQLEITDHDHLGKIITYASGLDAGIIIWIVKDFRDEHKQAIDWLNENTNENVNFFALKMELWKIGNSFPAPKFQIISKPNNWTKAVRKATQQANLTDTKLLQLDFWEKLKETGENRNSKIKFRGPRPQHWYTFSVGSSKAHLAFAVNSKEDYISCELFIREDQNLFRKLKERKEEVEGRIGEALEWQELESRKGSRIRTTKNIDFTKKENWEECFDWLIKKGEKFLQVFGDYLKKVDNE